MVEALARNNFFDRVAADYHQPRRLSRMKPDCQGNGDPLARLLLRFWMHFHVITGSQRRDTTRRAATPIRSDPIRSRCVYFTCLARNPIGRNRSSCLSRCPKIVQRTRFRYPRFGMRRPTRAISQIRRKPLRVTFQCERT